MKLITIFRRAALAALVALGAATASAQEAGTVTVTGTFHMDELQGTVGDDLAAVFANGDEHTWTVTLHGVSYSHFGTDSDLWSGRITNVYATSFDFAFSGPDAAILNEVVSDRLAGGQAALQLYNFRSNTGPSMGSTIHLWLAPPDDGAGMAFWAGDEMEGSYTTFPSDANGYPIVESEPYSFYCEETAILEDSGALVSWDNTLTIVGDLGTPIPATLDIRDAAVVEGSRGSTKLTLWVTLGNTSEQAVTVEFRTVDGTARSVGSKQTKADYTAASGTLTFQPGETRKTITISIKSDRSIEADELFYVELSNAVGATIANGVATVTIVDDD